MSVTLFPIIQPEINEPAAALELYREIKWDYENNVPIYKNGSPVIVEGREAVLVWAWKALHTPRYRHEIYTWSYGNEIESLMGQPFTDELKRSEAVRHVRDCLLVNPYIIDVTDVSVMFDDGKLSIECRIETIYGEVELNG